jgi:hypothetical protein
VPRVNFTTITISESVYKKAAEKIKAINDKVGYRKYRSIAHFAETAIIRAVEEEK